jgi:CRISPR type III-A-associated RAMP protein Csm3
MKMASSIQMMGKVVITGGIRLVTGLHIGGAAAGLDIGGVDNPIIRHPVTREPYIPGSSLRGKIRALLERAYNLPLNKKGARCAPPRVLQRNRVRKVRHLPCVRHIAGGARARGCTG